MKGYSTYRSSEPLCASPSSWRDGDSIEEKLDKNILRLSDLKNEMKKTKEYFDNIFQSRMLYIFFLIFIHYSFILFYFFFD